MLVGVDVDELQHALGGVVLEAAYLERVLRAAFSALVGSKYAAVVDGRLNGGRAHRGLRADHQVPHRHHATGQGGNRDGAQSLP